MFVSMAFWPFHLRKSKADVVLHHANVGKFCKRAGYSRLEFYRVSFKLKLAFVETPFVYNRREAVGHSYRKRGIMQSALGP